MSDRWELRIKPCVDNRGQPFVGYNVIAANLVEAWSKSKALMAGLGVDPVNVQVLSFRNAAMVPRRVRCSMRTGYREI